MPNFLWVGQYCSKTTLSNHCVKYSVLEWSYPQSYLPNMSLFMLLLKASFDCIRKTYSLSLG